MGIYVHSLGDQRVSGRDTFGTAVSLFADTKAEIAAEDDTVATVNEGVVKCIPGSDCVVHTGEVMMLNSAGVWAQWPPV